MKCLVTGAAGFVGLKLANALAARGDKVIALDCCEPAGLADGIEIVKCDIADLSALTKATEGCSVVFHQAAMRSVPRSFEIPYETFRVNLQGTACALEAARITGCRRFIFASSSSVYGDSGGANAREESALAPQSPYAASKAAAEAVTSSYQRSLGIETVILRYFNIYGARRDTDSQFTEVIPRFLSIMARGQRPVIFGDGLQTRDFVYIDDIVMSNLLAADSQKAAGNIYNVASGKSYNLLQLIELLKVYLGMRLQSVFEPMRLGDVKHTAADISAIRRDLGFEPCYGLEDGISRTALDLGIKKG